MNIPKILKNKKVQMFVAVIIFVALFPTAIILFVNKGKNREYFNGADAKLVM